MGLVAFEYRSRSYLSLKLPLTDSLSDNRVTSLAVRELSEDFKITVHTVEEGVATNVTVVTNLPAIIAKCLTVPVDDLSLRISSFEGKSNIGFLYSDSVGLFDNLGLRVEGDNSWDG